MLKCEIRSLTQLHKLVNEESDEPVAGSNEDFINFYLNHKPGTWRLVTASVDLEIDSVPIYHFFWSVPER